MDYGCILKKYRLLSGRSQEDMAFDLGLHQTAISKIENGQRGIDLPTFINWVQLMVNKEDLLKEVGLLESHFKKPIKEDYKGIFFDLIKNEMLQQQHP